MNRVLWEVRISLMRSIRQLQIQNGRLRLGLRFAE